jgi:hypothetical protein
MCVRMNKIILLYFVNQKEKELTMNIQLTFSFNLHQLFLEALKIHMKAIFTQFTHIRIRC